MYEFDPQLTIPTDNATIWRYVDLTRLIDMLSNNALFFTKTSKLLDPYEGTRPDFDLTNEYQDYMKQKAIWGEHTDTIIGNASKERNEFLAVLRENSVINCWHTNEYESAHMWKSYADDNLDIAIQSSVKRLKESFKKSDEYIRIGQVIYLDTEKEGIGIDWRYNKHFFVKRKSFSAENELRACISENFTYSNSKKKKFDGNGKYVTCDLNLLIEKIYLAPLSKPYFKNAVKSVISKYGLDKEVIKSDLFSLK